MEDEEKIPLEVKNRVEKMLELVNDLTLSDGSFPDYGDRDDGFVFRIHGNYDESPFPGLITIGAFFLNRPEWLRESQQSKDRLAFWASESNKR